MPLKGELSTPTPPHPHLAALLLPEGGISPSELFCFHSQTKAFVIGNQKVLVGETEGQRSLCFWGFRKSLPFPLDTLVTHADFFHSAWQVPGPGLRAEAFLSVGLWFLDNLNGWPAWWLELLSARMCWELGVGVSLLPAGSLFLLPAVAWVSSGLKGIACHSGWGQVET